MVEISETWLLTNSAKLCNSLVMNLRVYANKVDFPKTGQAVRSRRESLGMSLTDLAKKIKGDVTVLSRFERGEREISLKMLRKIEVALK